LNNLPMTVEKRGGTAGAAPVKTSASKEWEQAAAILSRIKAPAFPNQEFPITKFGAAADGKSDASKAISQAIEACHKAGGGSVIVPAGEYLTGPIQLKSGVNLHLDHGATLKFKTDPAAYLPAVRSWFEGMECFNYSPLIYAYEAQNIAVTGEGTLDGQADETNWWPWKGKKEYGWKDGVPHQKAARDRLGKMV
jgi:polygalacturonase